MLVELKQIELDFITGGAQPGDVSFDFEYSYSSGSGNRVIGGVTIHL